MIPKLTHHRRHPLGFAETSTGFTRQARYCGSTQSVPFTASQLGYGWLSRLSACVCVLVSTLDKGIYALGGWYSPIAKKRFRPAVFLWNSALNNSEALSFYPAFT